MSAQSDTQNAKVGIEQGGDRGFIKSGGEFDVETGGKFKLAGTEMSATAAELNKSAGVTGGTATASKAVVLDANKSITGLGAVTGTDPARGIGYATGAGGAVTQVTNRSTGVTLSKIAGAITTDTTSLAAGATAKFTVTNTAVAATDVVIVSIKSGTTTDQTDVKVQTVAAGSFDIVVANRHASTAETGAIIINFAVIKAVAA